MDDNGRVDREGDIERLEACLGRLAAGNDLAAALAACPPVDADSAAADPLRPLLALAARLQREGAALERPAPAFKTDLAARLTAAPAPSSLAASANVAPASDSAVIAVPAAAGPTPVATSAAPSTAGPAASPTPSTSELVRALDAWLSARRDERSAAIDASPADGAGAPRDLAPLLDLATTLSRDGARADGPSAAFRADLARRLAEAPPPRSVRAPRRAPAGLLQRMWRSTAFMAATAATVILCLGAGVTYASADALPGQWLYPVKRSVEAVRLAVASEGGAIDLRLDFAERRLAEAIGVPAASGSALADFSHQVSAALAIVDDSIAAGVPRERVAEPLVDWLVAARRELIVAQDGLPPIAWRGARALLDEAIVALSGGGIITGRAVWRLSEPAAVLALHDVPTHPWAWRIRRAGPPIALDPPPPAALVTAGNAITAPGGQGLLGERGPVAAAPASASVSDPAPASDPSPLPRDAGGSPSDPRPQRPSTPSPRPPDPTATPAPPEPTAPPTEPGPTAAPPTEPAPTDPPASPTAPPSPTPTPRIGLPLPARLEVYCAPETVESAGSTTCQVELPAAAMPGEVQWSASFGRIDVPDPDSPAIAIFTDNTGMSGVAKLIVTITVSFTPSDGPSSTGTTEVFIVPRLGGEGG